MEPLIACLQDEDPNARWFAAIALDRIGGTIAYKALDVFLKDIDLKELAENCKIHIKEAEDDYRVKAIKKDLESPMVFVLHKYGNRAMAEDYKACRNWILKSTF